MAEIWSSEETRQQIIKGINYVTYWSYSILNASSNKLNAVKNADYVYDSGMREVLDDVLNMDLSSEKVRYAIQAGIQCTGGVTLIMGPGGSGKSLIYKAIAHCVPRTLCLAPTGVAAYNLSAQGWGELPYTVPPMTIHSGLNMPAHDYFFTKEVRSMKKKLAGGSWKGVVSGGRKNIDKNRYRLILIDEISMVPPNLLDVLIAAAGELEIPMILFGDPMQLRPIEVKYDTENPLAASFASRYPGWNFFNSFGWTMLQGSGAARTLVLDSVYRQSDPGFKSMLNRMRVNEPTEGDWELLASRTVSEPPNGSLVLCKRNAAVNRINADYAGKRSLPLVLDREMMAVCDSKIQQRFRIMEGEMTGKDELVYEVLKKERPFDAGRVKDAPGMDMLKAEVKMGTAAELERDNAGFSAFIRLYPGDRVMITKNMQTETRRLDGGRLESGTVKVVNGMLGWYLGVSGGGRYADKNPAFVLLDTGEVVLVPRALFTKDVMRDNGKYETVAEAEQYPLKMAYAMTYHKAQGLTLDRVHMILDGDRTNWQVEGLGYLGLSRCRTLEGLTISGLSRREFLEDSASKRFMKHSEIYSIV